MTKIVFGIAILFAVAGCAPDKSTTITFEAYVDGKPLVYGEQYPSPNGDGTFMILDFKFYISNIRFTNSTTSELYSEIDSYHLAKFPNDSRYTISLDNLTPVDYDKIEFSIGIDEEANLGTLIAGDLDPTNQMAWNWTAGYKFLLLEGKYMPDTSNRIIPLIYHIGFNENRRDLAFKVDPSNDIRMTVDIIEMFRNPTNIDFHKYPQVLFNETDASMVAKNYSEAFITITP